MKPPAKKKGAEAPEETPDVERHDEVYFRHAAGPKVGRVLSRGQHGCVIEADGKRHKVHWENFLGHKVRVRPDVKVVDKGEDGFLVENGSGTRRFVRDPLGVVHDGEEPVQKSLRPAVLLFGSAEDLYKALGGGVKGRPGLHLEKRTDKNGRQTGRWVRNNAEHAKEPRGKHNVARGDHVKFDGPAKGEGHVHHEPGEHGVTVRDGAGGKHEVRYEHIAEHTPAERKLGEEKSAPDKPAVQGDEFRAADFAKEHDDADVSPESIVTQFDENTQRKLTEAAQRVKDIVQTIEKYREGEEYTAERQAAHRMIHDKFLSPKKVKAATPKDGQAPTFTILGGRGGSGKSKLDGMAYDSKKAIVIDPDEVKSMLPEYRGWNAHEVHEESSDIADDILKMARNMGLNVVLDGTLKTAKNALAKVEAFKEAGYRIETHYMHLPRQKAALRAVGRFMTDKKDGSGRYVPIEKILENTTNEDSFDQVRQHADKWSFYDNQVPKDAPPTLIAQGGKENPREA